MTSLHAFRRLIRGLGDAQMHGWWRGRELTNDGGGEEKDEGVEDGEERLGEGHDDLAHHLDPAEEPARRASAIQHSPNCAADLAKMPIHGLGVEECIKPDRSRLPLHRVNTIAAASSE